MSAPAPSAAMASPSEMAVAGSSACIESPSIMPWSPIIPSGMASAVPIEPSAGAGNPSGMSVRPFFVGCIRPVCSFCCRRKSFCACVRTCVGVRVPTCWAMDLTSFQPYRCTASINKRCSSGVQYRGCFCESSSDRWRSRSTAAIFVRKRSISAQARCSSSSSCTIRRCCCTRRLPRKESSSSSSACALRDMDGCSGIAPGCARGPARADADGAPILSIWPHAACAIAANSAPGTPQKGGGGP
mmetsp:Transcript_44620/g.104228  ORF Transcript_44620/g.104228 Transcript_44620/m.104228 type:complete len:243 (-) Transcript_44620:113-841(-)